MTLSNAEIFALERPDRKLLFYYFLCSLAALLMMPIVFVPLFFKYETLKYRFDEKGISMSWGIIFRQETYLTYRKIQDIHLTRNIVERWLGLGSLQIQTASGGSGAEMSIVGILALEPLRDFIYTQMKGHDLDNPSIGKQELDEKLLVLGQIRDKLDSIAAALEAR